MPAMPDPSWKIARFAAFFSAAMLMAPAASQAQLYTWKDAQGNITIKNSPPPWYDESGWIRGARVQVLRNGKVVDDTAWPAEKRQDIRSKSAIEEVKRIQSAVPGPRKQDAEE
jgi:hypothetical protein